MKKVLLSLFSLLWMWQGVAFERSARPVEGQKCALVCGAGGFIGTHMVTRLKEEGYWVLGVDIKVPQFSDSDADCFIKADLRNPARLERIFTKISVPFDEVYQFAANMGGMGFISSHDAEIMHDSALINLNVLEWSRNHKAKKIFIRQVRVSTQKEIKLTQIIQCVKSVLPIQLNQTPNMGGRSSLVRGSIRRMRAIMGWIRGLPACITSLVR